jgi:hypothetical protein
MRKIEDFEWGPMDEVGFIKSENFIDRVYNIHFEVKESLQSSYVSHSNQRLIIFYFFDIISNNEIFIKKKI